MLERGVEWGWEGGRYQHETDDNGETGDLDDRLSEAIE